MGQLLQPFPLPAQVRMQQIRQNDPQRDLREPDSPSHKPAAQEGRHHAARRERAQHPQVGPQPPGAGGVPSPAGRQPVQGYPHLPDMVRAEGGRHRNALGLPEGVVLHGAHEVDQNLSDLDRRGLRQSAQEQHRQHLEQHQRRLPPDQAALPHPARGGLGHEGAQAVGRDRDQKVSRAAPLSPAQRHRQQHDVPALRVAEHAAPDRVGERAEISSRQHHQGVYRPLLTRQIITGASALRYHDRHFRLYALIGAASPLSAPRTGSRCSPWYIRRLHTAGNTSPSPAAPRP